jgi:hypothetical protein
MELNGTHLARCHALDAFAGILGSATASVSASYFTLQTSDHVEPISRERVYCYELYHRLRLAWGKRVGHRSYFGPLVLYSLNGEVDKMGHAAFAGQLVGVKPDFVVHIPGSMDGNLVVIEVKRSSSSRESLRADLRKLSLMVAHAHYRRGILLIFGRDQNLTNLHEGLADDLVRLLATSALQIWHHATPGEQAIPIFGACLPCRNGGLPLCPLPKDSE